MRTVHSRDYQSYIQSPTWRAVRRRYWESKLPKFCYGCELPWLTFNQGMHVHHRTYKNLGNERLMDLIPLCQRCHSATHALIKTHHRSLWGAARQLRKSNNLSGQIWQSHMERISHAGAAFQRPRDQEATTRRNHRVAGRSEELGGET